jgi:SHS2 domain-containing protein
MKKYKLLDHTADVRFLVWGKTRKELFANTVVAMFDVMVDIPGDEKIKPLEEKTLIITGNDLEDILINFLREALYLFNGQGWLVRGCKPLELTDKSILARLQGELYNRQKNNLKTEIKAVTYHGLMINKSNKLWQAKVVFDV